MLASIKKYGILVLLAMVALTSCMNKNARKNNYPKPSTDFTLPVGKVYTIDTLLQMINPDKPLKFTEDASVYGVVSADETSGNLYKAAFLQDGDKALELYMKSTSGLRIGDSVRVYLKGAALFEYSGTAQIQDLDPNNITKIANNINIVPDTISVSDLNVNNPIYKCRLVAFKNVEFKAADRNNTFAPSTGYGEFKLAEYDENCNKIIDDEDYWVTVRTSSYASFAQKQLPQGKGTITGILTLYSKTWQLTIRSYSEVIMNNEPCEAPIIINDPVGSGTQSDPYNIAAAILHQYEEGQWIKGYIVGSANIASGMIENDSQISWGPDFTYNENVTNLILADKANENNINNCVVVYLPSNAESHIRDINLKDHPENLGKTLKVKGNLKTYLGKPGMKETNEYTLK